MPLGHYHAVGQHPGESRFFFWFILPYPVLIVLTVFIVRACARNSRPDDGTFNWFSAGLGAAASFGLIVAVSAGLFGIIHWAYAGRISSEDSQPGFPTDPKLLAISIAISAAAYIWAGAVVAMLSPRRPLPHALAAGAVLLLWSTAVTLLVHPLVISQLVVALALPIPLAAWGARLQQARKAENET